MVKDKAYYDSITELIIGCAYRVSTIMGCGFLEKIYENALTVELSDAGLIVETQKPIEVKYKEQIVGEYFADMVVEDEIIVELKATKSIENIHFAQCQNYLKATGKNLAWLSILGRKRSRSGGLSMVFKSIIGRDENL